MGTTGINRYPGETTERFDIGREVRVIPAWAVAVAALIFICLQVFFHSYVWPRESNPPPVIAQVLISTLATSILAFLILLIGYVNRDAKRRGMNSALWTVLVIFIPNAIGFIIYFLVRHPLLSRCPRCSAEVSPRYNFCPNCDLALAPTCTKCRQPVRAGDSFCPFCGSNLKE